ncbi:MAG: type II toxin-antitoxin system RelE/ParE family toxin [bacterium]
MNYRIVFHSEAKKEFDELDGSLKILVLKQLKKLISNPLLGEAIGNKAGINLSGYRKTYVNNKKIRIVYKIFEEKVEVFVIAINKRDNMKVYEIADKRN